MTRLERRVEALESGNGYLGVSEALDGMDDPAVNLADPRTYPARWFGKVWDPAFAAALDGLGDVAPPPAGYAIDGEAARL